MSEETGEIIEVTMVKDEFLNITYQVALVFTERPSFKLGKAKIIQD